MLERRKIVTKYTRDKEPAPPPICGICGKRITVAELLAENFEAVKGRSGYTAFYHRECIRQEGST